LALTTSLAILAITYAMCIILLGIIKIKDIKEILGRGR